MLFRDALDNVAVAEELDVYVVRVENESRAVPSGDADTNVQDGSFGLQQPSASVPPSFVRTRVEIGAKPLIVRTSRELNSAQIGQLNPGQLVSVLDEVIMVDGTVRALVREIDDEEGTYAILDSWRKLSIDAREELASVLECDPAINPGLFERFMAPQQLGRSPTRGGAPSPTSRYSSKPEESGHLAGMQTPSSGYQDDAAALRDNRVTAVPLAALEELRCGCTVSTVASMSSHLASLNGWSLGASHATAPLAAQMVNGGAWGAQVAHRSAGKSPARAVASQQASLTSAGHSLRIARGALPNHRSFQTSSNRAGSASVRRLRVEQAACAGVSDGQKASHRGHRQDSARSSHRSSLLSERDRALASQRSSLLSQGDKALTSQRSSLLSQRDKSISSSVLGSPVRSIQQVCPPRSPVRHFHGTMGWITCVKAGETLVKSRNRLNAGQRQQHKQQWERRLRTDRSLAKATPGTNAKEFLPKSSLAHSSNAFANELTSDPSGIGFAFGGVEPGTQKAHGQLHEIHRAHYSVGRIGRYLLHVGLRAQAVPLPGSPFELTVVSGPAHAPSTRLPPCKSPIRGTVGISDDSSGCRLLVQASDKMGNKCAVGGAKVTSWSDSDQVVGSVQDREDGWYQIEWRSKYSGHFRIGVMIDGQHIVGSPISMRLNSTVPALAKTRVGGDGLSDLIAGGLRNIVLNFMDEFNNTAMPGSGYTFGLALIEKSEKADKKTESRASMQAIQSTGQWSEGVDGEWSMSFTPTKAGNMELHVWCDALVGTKSERQQLPGSPFQVGVVESGAVSSEVSNVAGFSTETFYASERTNARTSPTKTAVTPAQGSAFEAESRIAAGDTVIIKPMLRDNFGNPAQVPEGALAVGLETPDSEFEQELTPEPRRVHGLTTYEIRHETRCKGRHAMHVRLNGVPVTGSPVAYDVSPNLHSVPMTVIEVPQAKELFVDDLYDITLRLHDTFANQLECGGASVSAKMLWIKQGVHDTTTLSPHNHTCGVEDLGDGTYRIRIGLSNKSSGSSQGFQYLPGQVEVLIVVEKADMNAKKRETGGGTSDTDLPKQLLTFQRPPENAPAPVTVTKSNKQLQRMLKRSATEMPPRSQRLSKEAKEAVSAESPGAL